MAAGVKPGDHVWISDNGKDVIGHVTKAESGEGEKATVQAPDGSTAQYGYRAEDKRDEHGSGGTFWLVK